MTVQKIIEHFQKDIGDPTLRGGAGLLGVSYTALSEWKNGKYQPGNDTLLASEHKILRALQCVRELRDLVVPEAAE
jgi:hypothetical protein